MKILVTSGCSFSDYRHNTWPNHLGSLLPEYTQNHLGLMSQGNGIISRKLIYKVNQLLKTNSASELLVGIMWSGPNRHDFYNSFYPKNIKNQYDIIENPTGFVDNDKSWIIFNHFWDTEHCQNYYRNYHDPVFGYVTTMEHILRTQWFLEKHKIKYFMTTYTSEVFLEGYIKHPEVEYLYRQINFDTFLPIQGEYEWCRDFSKFEFPLKDDHHPSPEQHREFTEQVIIPFLKKKQII